MGRKRTGRRARAFAPGHVTGFFVPELSARDPRARGSVGAGFVLDRGVVAEAHWDPAGADRIRLRSIPRVSLPISRAVARRLKGPRRGSLSVELSHQLPIGQGLGMSAAGALATGLAVAAAVGVEETRAWQWAHLTELELGGGLGGVAALGGGGLEFRERPGVPPWGRVRHVPVSVPVVLSRFGPPLPTPRMLADARRSRGIRQAGVAAIRGYRRRPGWARFLSSSEEFTDAVGLLPRAGRDRVQHWRGAGWAVAQAMFGRMLFAVPRPRGRGGGSAGPDPVPRRGRIDLRTGIVGAHLLD